MDKVASLVCRLLSRPHGDGPAGGGTVPVDRIYRHLHGETPTICLSHYVRWVAQNVILATTCIFSVILMVTCEMIF